MPRPQTILLIEPSDDSRDMHADHLRTCGCTVLTADTTDHGLSRASDTDVIVTGIRVPPDVTYFCRSTVRPGDSSVK